ncbi:protein SMG9-like isoform X2 [Asparagus officinalis]|uniref:protein SMG9-like isoform X2 n=1 Tax=Asparagus officinalis TaxID=4686 RepID=UPI00098E3856|nr:protein SMG9-like isoform X2 [Asparagus officinalis]
MAGAPPSSSSSSSSSSSANPSSSSGLPPPPPPPKILLAKPSPGPAAAQDSSSAGAPPPSSVPGGVLLRPSRNAPQPGSLNLFSDTWEFHTERILPFLTDNTDFNVVGIIGPTGVGKSTILNELYGFDGSSPGMLPPFATQSEETIAMAKHCTAGVELRVSSERLILLDAQPMFSPSVLVDMMRPDGLSTISVLNGESLSADLAHELLGIQIGVFLLSVCNVLLVASEGIYDFSMWKLMLTVDLLKHDIPDPSMLTSAQSQASTTGAEKDNKVNQQLTNEEHLAAPVFIHTKLQDRDLSPSNTVCLKSALSKYLKSSSFADDNFRDMAEEQVESKSSDTMNNESKSTGPSLFLLPLRTQDGCHKPLFGSYDSMLAQLRDQILSMNGCSFVKPVSERDWLRNLAKIWELVKKSPVISEYCKTLQRSGLFRR